MTSPVPDALRTQLAEDRARIAEALNKAGYGPVFADGPSVGVVADLLARARVEGAAEARAAAVSEFNRLADEIRDEAEDVDSEEAAWALGVVALKAEVIGELLGTTPALSASTTTEGDPT